jgi:hypothetical protein
MGCQNMRIEKISARAFLLSLILLLLPMVSPASADDSLTETGNRAFEDLTRCINTKKILDVYYLIDQSGSLKLTDKNDERADILAASLSALGDFNSDVKVNYAVTFFGDGTDNWAPWSAVSKSSIESKANALRSEITKPSRKRDFNTDWLAGLQRAQKDLNLQKAKSNGCQALIWLTDGGIWLQEGSGYGGAHNFSEERTNAAVSTLCTDVMPTLRADGVSVFGVLLKNDKQLDQIEGPAREQTINGMSHMYPLVEGSLDGNIEGVPENTRECGVVPIPANQSAGAVLIASDPVELALKFMGLTAATQGGIEADLGSGNPTKFNIDKGVRKFQLVSTTKNWKLTGPNSQSYFNGTSGVTVRQSTRITTITVDVGTDEIGQWQFSFENGAKNKLFLFSELDVKVSRSGFVAGENGTLSGKIVTRTNLQPVDLSAYKKAEIRIEEISSNGEIDLLDNVTATNSGKFSLDNFRPMKDQKQVELRITMPLTTVGGTKLKPISITQVIEVPNRTNFPTLEEVPVKVSDLREQESGSGSIRLVGPKVGTGKVCFVTTENNGIDTVSDEYKNDRVFLYEIEDLPSSGCIQLAQKEPRTLNIKAKTLTSGEGDVEAILSMSSYSDSQPDGVIEDQVPVEFKTTLEKAWQWLITLLLYILGIALPWLFSYIQNRITTKIAFGPKVQRATLPVLVHSTKGVTLPDGSSVTIKAEDFKFIPEQTDTSLYRDPLGEMRAKTSINVLRAPWFEVSANLGNRLLTMIPAPLSLKRRFTSGQIAPMKGNIENFWALQISDADLLNPTYSASIPATLLIFKRNKLSNPNQHIEVLMKAVQTPGIWSAISAMPRSIDPIKGTKAIKKSEGRRGKGSAQLNPSHIPPKPVVDIPPPPPGMAPPPPPPPNF